MIGQALGHYRIEAKLGEGGMGVVYRAFDTHLDRPVAIKILRPEATTSPERRHRFQQEAKAASALNHPNIVHIYDVSSSGGTDYIIMEFVAGKTLDKLIGKTGLAVKDTLKYAIQVADALTRAHAAGIVHRDLKPSNIIVSDDGRVKLLDFGLAKLIDTTAPTYVDSQAYTATMTIRQLVQTEEGTIVGTVAYMSPEQAEARNVDARSDIFSFGSVMYEMVTGRRPFECSSKISTFSAILHEEPAPLAEVAPDVPAELDKIISRCLRKDPNRRLQHAGDIKLALEELEEDFVSRNSSRAVKAGNRAGRDTPRRARVDLRMGGYRAIPALGDSAHENVLAVRLARVFGLAVQKRDKRNVEPGAVLLRLALQRDSMHRGRRLALCRQYGPGTSSWGARKFAPWLRALGPANGALAIIMTVWIAEAHTVLAAVLALLGIAMGVTAMTLKLTLDRIAIYSWNRWQ